MNTEQNISEFWALARLFAVLDLISDPQTGLHWGVSPRWDDARKN
jgi:hypothetical protein